MAWLSWPLKIPCHGYSTGGPRSISGPPERYNLTATHYRTKIWTVTLFLEGTHRLPNSFGARKLSANWVEDLFFLFSLQPNPSTEPLFFAGSSNSGEDFFWTQQLFIFCMWAQCAYFNTNILRRPDPLFGSRPANCACEPNIDCIWQKLKIFFDLHIKFGSRLLSSKSVYATVLALKSMKRLSKNSWSDYK